LDRSRGFTQALIRTRIPYLPVHADDIERDAGRFSLLVLPNLAAMSDSQVNAVRRFVQGGGALVATGQTSLFDQHGEARRDFALNELFRAHPVQPLRKNDQALRRRQAGETLHTYLRLVPELRGGVDGPHVGTEPPISTKRHSVLRGFDETDILPFGGSLEPLRIDGGARVLMTFVPQFPIYPPETAWMREPKTDISGLIVNETAGGGRAAFMPR